MLLMVDRVTGYWPTGSRNGKARLRGEKTVRPGEWFFKAHFHQDPVQPGSLGLEALLQLLQYHAIRKDWADWIGADPVFIALAPHAAPTTWRYRGQVLPTNQLITVEAEILSEERQGESIVLTGDGALWCDGLLIYEAFNLSLMIKSSAETSFRALRPSAPPC